MLDYADLPGGDIISTGLADLERGAIHTPEALLVAAASARLRAVGVPVAGDVDGRSAPLELYRALQPEYGDDAHGRQLALLRRVESFARAAEHASRR